MKKEFKFLPALISLIAGLVISIIMIKNGDFSITSIIIVLAFLLGFYIVGLIFKSIILFFKTKDKPKTEEEQITEEELENVATDSEDTAKG